MVLALARYVVGLVLLGVSCALALQLWNGRWQSLIAKPSVTKKGTFYPEGTRKAGQRVAWVMVACFAAVATLMAFDMAKMAGLVPFAQVASLLCNAALVCFCILAVWALFARSGEQDAGTRFGTGKARVALLLLASCVVLTLVSLLFA